METQITSGKKLSALLLAGVFSAQSAFAQKPDILEVEDNNLLHNALFVIGVLLFIVGFIVLLVLKVREDRKNESKPDEPHTPIYHHHRHHYGHRHQYRPNHH